MASNTEEEFDEMWFKQDRTITLSREIKCILTLIVKSFRPLSDMQQYGHYEQLM